MKWYVWIAPKDRQKFIYEGHTFESRCYTVGLYHPLLLSEEDIKKQTGNKKPSSRTYRRATESELAWGIPINSELMDWIEPVDRTKLRFIQEGE